MAKKFNVKLDFFPFIKVEGLPAKEFRKQKIDILSYTAVIFTSRNAVDHFFRICEEMKIKVSQDCKYFCITEAVALYLQKFILYRKRKVFFGADGSTKGVLEVMNKHKDNEKFLFPSSDSQKKDIEEWLKANKCEYATATLYKTVSTDVKEVLAATNYDMIVFFSPSGVKSLFENVPGFVQNGTHIGAFGPTTSAAVEEAGLRLDVKAPQPQAPSMVAALEQYLTSLSKK
ncbi:uroporphyrinogen-III synthase [Chitinophaga terrae (ex Kim and Jung 2007)]|uniref:uroporphyrinogen-III synthase n=1 Tax=Chitinophaga terrae (ex Kim and Jung 2007) TaxID=408074 RepID=UPI002784609F|nr:uroporphyrinogen-III synthase [Chitinophaga terrae (ex Kim and Jung 2007)]MDQ0105055.1 uroporphyrinogen-III synthase [Chitinophaga terrae (ex Kim and Jung 2007)]